VEKRPLRLALVLWGGYVGGAETFTADLARALAARGAEPSVVFVLDGQTLADRLDRYGIPHCALGLRRGRAVLRAPRRLARTVSAVGPDAAILVEAGWFPAALRIGGYRGAIIGIEHGSRLQLSRLDPLQRLVRQAALGLGMNACSAVVGVSEYMSSRIPRGWGNRRVVCISNGVDLERLSPAPKGTADGRDGLVIACAARLVDGKGVEDVLQALAHPRLRQMRLRTAGDGPRLEALRALSTSLGVDDRVEFLGTVHDMPSFWRHADVAVAPSNQCVESFGVSALEAMACAKPVVVTDNGGLPEVVVDEETGLVVPPGDVPALVRALGEYAEDPQRRLRHGSAGRRRCEAHYAIEQTASRYLELCAELILARGRQK
jgi:glycosyltransferase involved in cell wall biosynthesis